MANSKISALTAATTPLAGTEVAPIVQSGVTKQVSVNNLTIGRTVEVGSKFSIGMASSSWGSGWSNSEMQGGSIASNATTNLRMLQNCYFDGANYIYKANGFAYRYEISNGAVTWRYAASGVAGASASFTTYLTLSTAGDATLSTGNLVIGTSGKGIDFSATPGTGTSELFADYEEGNWTPIDSSGAGLSLSVTSAIYTKIGRQVTCWANLAYPATASGASAVIGGLPFASNATFGGGAIQGYFAARTFTITSNGLYGGSSATTMNIDKNNGAAVATNADLSSTAMYFVVNYTV